jgi:hypothetical protein
VNFLTCVFCFYLEVGVGHKVSFDTSEDLMNRGDNPTAHLSSGVDYNYKPLGIVLNFQYSHTSHYFNGWPLNEKEEFFLGEFKFVVRKYLNN